MLTKELQHKWLAVFVVAGIVAQESETGKEICVDFGLASSTLVLLTSSNILNIIRIIEQNRLSLHFCHKYVGTT